jgi:hypothetical protein
VDSSFSGLVSGPSVLGVKRAGELLDGISGEDNGSGGIIGNDGSRRVFGTSNNDGSAIVGFNGTSNSGGIGSVGVNDTSNSGFGIISESDGVGNGDDSGDSKGESHVDFKFVV